MVGREGALYGLSDLDVSNFVSFVIKVRRCTLART